MNTLTVFLLLLSDLGLISYFFVCLALDFEEIVEKIVEKEKK